MGGSRMWNWRAWLRNRLGPAESPPPPAAPVAAVEQGFPSEDVNLPDWKPRSRRPKLALLQLRASYREPQGDDRRIVHVEDPGYEEQLVSALSAAIRSEADFICFPEFAWPENAVDALLDALEHLPEGCVCIAPFEHLTVPGYERVLKALPLLSGLGGDASVDEGMSASDRSEGVVNVAIVFVRVGDRLVAIPQRKLLPAGLEQGLKRWRFLGGSVVRVVRGDDFSFATAICFDVIARDDAFTRRPRNTIGARGVDLLLVPECNPEPLHESYSHSLIDLYQSPTWASRNPVVAFTNVARGTVLPGIAAAAFGFSRVVGRLGQISEAIPHVFMQTVDELLTADTPTSLRGLDEVATRSPFKNLKSLIFRPQESLVEVSLPTIGTGPTKDPTAGRVDTEVRVHRRVKGWREGWQVVRPGRRANALSVPTDFPRDLLGPEGLVGAETALQELFAATRREAPMVWVLGDGGVGKTALVATLLKGRFSGPRWRIVWIDMGRVPRTEEALLEELLLVLGKAGALTAETEEQWRVLETELEQPTIVVLDSLDLWGDAVIPRRLVEVAARPSRLIATSRKAPPESVGELFELRPLGRDAASELMNRTAGIRIPETVFDAVYTAVTGSPLACVWVGGYLRLAHDGGEDLAKKLTGTSAADLETIFEWSVADLSPIDRDVLSVLCELPAPVQTKDLQAVLVIEEAAIADSLKRLRAHNLLIEEEPQGLASGGGQGTRHPFVRKFWAVSGDSDMQRGWPRIVQWATAELERSGGDGNWSGFIRLKPKWPNIRHVLDTLMEDGERQDQRLFLTLWRRADYFLWSAGRRRERLELGRRAEQIARNLSERSFLAHALYDSIAETEWHRRWGREQAEPLLDEAAGIYADLGDAVGRTMVEYYRARLLTKKTRPLDAALSIALGAVELARATADGRLVGLTLNALGNVYRNMGEWKKARSAYEEAGDLLRNANDEEMKAVVWRNLGRVSLLEGRLGEAIASLEEALNLFQDLALADEEAEAAKDHARTLHRLGESEAAGDELLWCEQTFERLGAVGRRKEVEEAKKEIGIV